VIGSFLGAIIYQFVIDFFKHDTMKELLDKLQFQETTTLIMENLDEALLSFNEKGLHFLNNKGFGMVSEIQYSVLY